MFLQYIFPFYRILNCDPANLSGLAKVIPRVKLTIMMVLCIPLADVVHGDTACCKDNFTVP